ncbi:MAG: response regulator [Myxococcales bacterium]|nr:response regulator [Myxococcales bacterium]
MSALLLLVKALFLGPSPEWGTSVLLLLVAVAVLGVVLLARRGHVRAAGVTLTAVVLVGVTAGPLVRGQVGYAPFFVVIATIVAAVTLEPRDVYVTIGAGLLSLALIAWLGAGFSPQPGLPGGVLVNGVILFGLLSAVAVMMAVGVRRLLDDLDLREREAHQAREEARQADVRARVIADNTGDLITLVSLQGEVVWVSPSHRRVLGAGALAGQYAGWNHLVHPEDLQPILDAFSGASQGRVVRRQLRLKQRDGTWGWFEALFSPVPGEPFVVVATRDVTEVRALSAQLEASQKMEALGRLAGGVAHDFNNLLSVMQSCASLVRSELPEGNEAGEDLDDLQGAIERATALTRQLLAFSRREVVVPSRLVLGEVLAPTVDLVRRLLGKQVEVRFSLAPGGWPVRAAVSQLEQVVMNLCVNARDAMPQGGLLELEVAPVQDGALGEAMCLSVRDNGTGMSEETRSRLFEPFFTTKPPGRGTGLGLATVYGIVNGLGGRIEVHTALGKGSEFRVLLPRAPEGEATVPSPSSSSLQRPSPLVFVVDDDSPVRTLMVKLLTGGGFQVRHFPSGEEALGALTASNRPDVLVTDVMLPRMDGVRLAEAFRERLPGLQVVLVSGFAPNPAATERLVAQGARFLPKPFTPATLLAAVQADAGPPEEEPAQPGR